MPATLPLPLPARPPRRVAGAALAALLATTAACAGRGAGRGAGRTPPAAPARPAPAGRATLPPPISAEDAAYLRERRLVVPVAGARVERIADSFADGRSGGRLHLAVDILAPRGTAVLAADDGRIWRLRQGGIGGITIYATDPADRFVYYYAHLDRYRDGLAEGMAIVRGDTLGFVGTTGNAPADVPHLHFQVGVIGPDRRYWTGIPVDPLPFWREQAALARRGDDAPPPLATRAPAPAPTRPPARPAARATAAPPDAAPIPPRGAVRGTERGAGRVRKDADPPARRGGLARPTVPVDPADTSDATAADPAARVAPNLPSTPAPTTPAGRGERPAPPAP